LSLYVQATLPNGSTDTKQLSFNVCNGEVLSALNSATAQVNLNVGDPPFDIADPIAYMSAYFAYSPQNGNNPTCNTFGVTVYSDAAKTIEFVPVASTSGTGGTAELFELVGAGGRITTGTSQSMTLYIVTYSLGNSVPAPPPS